jgi:hypothetical protein
MSYKVNYLNGDKIILKIVFYGNNLDVPNPNKVFTEDPHNEAFATVFSAEELPTILENNIPIHFSKQQIHFDDTIGVIKIKILMEFANLRITSSLEQIYLFCVQEEEINPTSVYQILTQNNHLELTRIRLEQFLSNIVNPPVHITEEKDIYTYDDIIQLNLSGKKLHINKVLGQKFIILSNEYPFICNPFLVASYDPFIERAARKSLTTLNNQLLLNTGTIIENNIYVCLAPDVLLNAQSKSIGENDTINIYYPFLLKKDVHSFAQLEDKKWELVEENKRLTTQNNIETFDSINMFYDIYKYRGPSKEYKYKGGGLKFIKLVIHPVFNIKIPLDIIFKIIHATKNSPFIKYNASAKIENIYRLYANKISTDGRKIPFLSKPAILKLNDSIGKTKSVSIYFNNIQHVNLLSCEFEDNGSITITCDHKKTINIPDMDHLIKTYVNPVIQEVKDYLEQSGYSISIFENIFSQNIEIKKIDYQSTFEIKKKIKIDKLVGCITSAFIIETKNIDDPNGINMRFKRVANFNKMTSQEAFVVEQANQKDGLKGSELIEALVENYGIEEQTALELLAKIASEVQVERNVKRNDTEIKLNPGFKTIIKQDNSISTTTTITIDVENINNIYYLDVLPVYIVSLIILTQDKKSTSVPLKIMNGLCTKVVEDEEPIKFVLDEIVSPSEASFLEQEVPIIEDGELIFVEQDYVEKLDDYGPKITNAVDLIFGYEEEEEEEDEEEDEEEKNKGERGGAGSSDPESLEEFPSLSPSLSEQEQEEPIEEPREQEQESKYVTKKIKQKEEKKEKEIQEDAIKNVVGLSLKNPSPFVRKMFSLEPTLFLKEDNGKFNRYSRSCSSTEKKQPVLITQEELDEIKEEDLNKIIENHGGTEKFEAYSKEKQSEILKDESFLKPEDVIKYGTNPDNKYYYICPRYWCLKTNKPIDPSEMVSVLDPKTGKMVKRHPTCGGIIPNTTKKIKKGDKDFVYEFFNPIAHGSQENYKKHYPGFLKSDKHPDGLCIPCCFSKWNTPGQVGRRKECEQKEEEKEEEEEEGKGKGKGKRKGEGEGKGNKKEKEKEIEGEEIEEGNKKEESEPIISKKVPKKIVEKDTYIKGPEKFPLEKGRWGYLQIGLQHFFQEAGSDCQISNTNTNVKPNYICLLRHGTEFSKTQSFISCIADARFFGESDIPDIAEMKTRIIHGLNIDNYITYQNGNLVTSFSKEVDDVNVDIDKYTDSKLYKNIYTESPDELQVAYFKKVVTSFENFIDYLNDPNEIIDYTYLWDIICRPNPEIFLQGINLIILEIVNNDTTNNIEIICPTNHYSNEFYNSSKQTLFIVKQDGLYEPIYTYENKIKTLKIVRTFSEHSQSLSSNIRAIFKKIIKPVLKDMCAPLASIPNIYKFDNPILLSKLILLLNKKRYTILNQILNFQSKVIGLFVRKGDNTGYIPCYPSALDPTYPDFVFMNDPQIYNTYNNTIDFLTTLFRETKGVVPVKPDFKIVEDEHIVGILTQSNQFIQLSEPMLLLDVNDDIPVINDSNYIVNKNISVDTEIQTSVKKDGERISYVKKIKLETNFYNSFRNTIKILLNDYENIKLREQIEKLINTTNSIFSTKLHDTIELLKELVGTTIIFADEYNYELINSVSTCITLPKDKCAKNPICAVSASDKCQLIIPKYNLIVPQNNNEIIYYGKMADELIRYSRIKSFIFEPQKYLSFGNIGYNLREDEIIIIYSLLTKDYFDGLIPETVNTFVKYNTYDNAEPNLKQIYDNTVEFDYTQKIKGDEEGEVRKCIPTETGISSKIWKPKFPNTFREMYYDKANCGFYLLIDIIQNKTGTVLSINDIKRELLEEYQRYFERFGAQIIDILILEGKKTEGTRVKQKTISFQHFIYSDDYFITNLDLWVILARYKVPSIIVSSKPIILTNKTRNELVLYGSQDDNFVFIYSPALRAESIPKYSIIKSVEFFYPLSIIKDESLVRSIIENIITLPQMFQSFTKKSKKSVKLVIVEDKEEEEEEEEEGEEEIGEKDVLEEKVSSDLIFPVLSEDIVPQEKTRKQKTTVVLKKPKTKKIRKLKIVEE